MDTLAVWAVEEDTAEAHRKEGMVVVVHMATAFQDTPYVVDKGVVGAGPKVLVVAGTGVAGMSHLGRHSSQEAEEDSIHMVEVDVALLLVPPVHEGVVVHILAVGAQVHLDRSGIPVEAQGHSGLAVAAHIQMRKQQQSSDHDAEAHSLVAAMVHSDHGEEAHIRVVHFHLAHSLVGALLWAHLLHDVVGNVAVAGRLRVGGNLAEQGWGFHLAA